MAHQAQATRKQEIFDKAVTYLASAIPSLQPQHSEFRVSVNRNPILYGPSGSPLPPIQPDSYYNIRRTAAKRTGSMQNWIPRRMYTRDTEAREREDITLRAIDLVNSDPHAAGAVDSYAATVVGPGLVPQPIIDPASTGITKDQARTILGQMKTAYVAWYRFADAGQRMTFGEIQHLIQRNLIQYGEYLVLCHMIDDPSRPYMLALQVINPLRLKTPADLASSGTIKDGVELGPYGEPVAYWIKKSSPTALASLADTSANFVRIPYRKAHRSLVLHNFINREPEQIRGISDFATAMKFFRDLNDYLDAELVSNIVTAAFSLFIETGSADPYSLAQGFATTTDQRYKSDNTPYNVRFQEVDGGGNIIYGNDGQKVTPLIGNRPGQTFEPFIRAIKKSIAMALGIPYVILFKDVDNATFAVFRSAMLEAWRVFSARRTWLGQGFCQPVYTMLMEEAWLKGQIDLPEFYGPSMYALTAAEWRGAPKGDIEPVKAALADIELINARLKTRSEAIAERGGDLVTTFDQLEEEDQMLIDRNLKPEPVAVDTTKERISDSQKNDAAQHKEENAEEAEKNA